MVNMSRSSLLSAYKKIVLKYPCLVTFSVGNSVSGRCKAIFSWNFFESVNICTFENELHRDREEGRHFKCYFKSISKRLSRMPPSIKRIYIFKGLTIIFLQTVCGFLNEKLRSFIYCDRFWYLFKMVCWCANFKFHFRFIFFFFWSSGPRFRASTLPRHSNNAIFISVCN